MFVFPSEQVSCPKLPGPIFTNKGAAALAFGVLIVLIHVKMSGIVVKQLSNIIPLTVQPPLLRSLNSTTAASTSIAALTLVEKITGNKNANYKKDIKYDFMTSSLILIFMFI